MHLRRRSAFASRSRSANDGNGRKKIAGCVRIWSWKDISSSSSEYRCRPHSSRSLHSSQNRLTTHGRLLQSTSYKCNLCNRRCPAVWSVCVHAVHHLAHLAPCRLSELLNRPDHYYAQCDYGASGIRWRRLANINGTFKIK